MKLSRKCRGYLWKLAIRKFEGNEYLFRRVNIFGPNDLVHQFLADKWDSIQNKTERLIFEDFKQYVIQQIRTAKELDRRAREYTFTDQIKTSNKRDLSLNPGTFSFDDSLNFYLMHHGGYGQPEEDHLRLGAYVNPFTGEINIEAMVWDMKRVMCRWDRYWKCANDYEYYRLKDKELKTDEFLDIMGWTIEDPWLHSLIGIIVSALPSGTHRVLQYALDENKKWTQKEIAKKLGLNQSTVNRQLNHVGISALKYVIKNFKKYAYFRPFSHVS